MNPIVLQNPKAVPNMKPATPARAPPITNVREMVLSMSMPMRAAVGASSATARMLRPSFVRFTSWSRKSIMTTAVTTMIAVIGRDLGAAHREEHVSQIEVLGERVVVETVEEFAGEIRQEQRRTDRTDQEGELGRAAFTQGLVGDLLEQPRDDRAGRRADNHPDQHRERHHDAAEMSIPDDRVYCQEAAETARHEHFAVCEVDQLQHAVHERVAQP